MSAPEDLTDRIALKRNRARAGQGAAMFLHRHAIDEMKERLKLVNRRFTAPVIVTSFPGIWASAFPGARVVADTETLPLERGAHDLVIHAMALHWSNDPVGQMVQARLALRPDGLFLGLLPGGQTLHQLRTALAEAEVALCGGLSPRVLPMADIRDLGHLLQRAGFALPVSDSFTLSVRYRSLEALLHDLRDMGETNAMAQRSRTPLAPAVLAEAARIYRAHFADGDALLATFELMVLTGWAPAPGQPRPLRPGSATARLADALGTSEQPLDDPARPRRP